MRVWIAVLVLLCSGLAFASEQPPQTSGKQVGSAQQQYSASEKQAAKEDIWGSKESPFIVRVQKDKEETDSEKKDSTQRTDAQRDAHLIGWATIVILFVQAGVFIWQGWQLRKTVREMKTATEATKEIADITRNSLLTQRAFIFLKVINIEPVRDNQKHLRAWRFTPVLTNSGTTPTRNARSHHSRVVVTNAQLPEEFDFPDAFTLNECAENDPVFFGPKADIWGDSHEFTVVDIDMVYRRKQNIYIYGWVDYDDIFPKTPRRRTEYCFQIIVSSDPSKGDPACVTFRSYKKHNGADEECLKKPTPM